MKLIAIQNLFLHHLHLFITLSSNNTTLDYNKEQIQKHFTQFRRREIDATNQGVTSITIQLISILV